MHRLDPDASGLMIFAKTKSALDFLSGQFQAKSVQTKFFAFVTPAGTPPIVPVVAGVRDTTGALPPDFEVNASLAADPRQAGAVRLSRGRGAKDALTRFHVLERFDDFHWIECHPVTTRPHQIRAHLAAAGAPILGDSIYGASEYRLLLSQFKRGYKGREDEKPLVSRLALHSAELNFKHPETRESLTLVAPLTTDLEIALKNLRKFTAIPRRR